MFHDTGFLELGFCCCLDLEILGGGCGCLGVSFLEGNADLPFKVLGGVFLLETAFRICHVVLHGERKVI